MHDLLDRKMLTLEETLTFARPIDGPREELPSTTDVLIVGAGPVGLAALNMLEALGVHCVLVERNPTTSALPKAIAIDDEFTRLLSNLGFERNILETASFPFGIHFRDRSDGALITVNAFHTLNGFGNRIAISQPVLERILLERPPRRTSTVRFGTSVTALLQSDGQVDVEVQDEEGHRQSMQAKYVLACDGAKSSIRDFVGIAFPGRRIDEPHLVIDLAEFPDQTPASRFFCNPKRPLNSIPGPFGGRRLEFMLNPDDNREWLLQDEGIRWLVDEFSPYRGVDLRIIRRAIYGFSARIADRFQQKRVFLMGDAAHVMPPFGGQGLNTGARDVSNLGWKLAMVLNGKASAAILDSYDGERRGQVDRIVKYSVAVGTLTNIRSSMLSSVRDVIVRLLNRISPVRDYLSSMRYMPRPSIDVGLLLGTEEDRSKLVGKVFPRINVRDHRGVTGPIDQWIGFNHALLSFDADASDVEALTNVATQQSIPLFVGNVVGEGGPVANDATLQCVDAIGEKWLAAHSGHCFLVRPDRYTAGRVRNREGRRLVEAYASLLSATIGGRGDTLQIEDQHIAPGS